MKGTSSYCSLSLLKGISSLGEQKATGELWWCPGLEPFYREWKAQAAVCNWTADIFFSSTREGKGDVKKVWFHPFHRWGNWGSGEKVKLPAQTHETGKEPGADWSLGVSNSNPKANCLPLINSSSWHLFTFPESWCSPGSSAHLGSEKGNVLITPYCYLLY